MKQLLAAWMIFTDDCMDAKMTLLAFIENDMLAQILLILGVLVLVATLLINIVRRRGRRGSSAQIEEQRITASERLEQMGQVKGMRGDLRNLMVEIEELSRHLSAQLDAKSIRIEKLIIEAEEKIARLEALEHRMAGDSSMQASPQVPPSVPEPAPYVAPVQPAVTSSPTPEPVTQATSSAASANGVDPVKQRIYDMADAGQSAVEIAKAMNEHVGKIELILNLRN